jgi:hypothetical protein
MVLFNFVASSFVRRNIDECSTLSIAETLEHPDDME